MSSNSNSMLIYDNAAFDSSDHSPLPLQPVGLSFTNDLLKENINPSPIPAPPSAKKPPISIDDEIADVESQIHRLSKRLDSLKIKKAQIQLSTAAAKTPASSKRGRIVPAKFLTPQEPRRRGLSLGPQEIYRKPTFPKLEGIKEEKKPKPKETPAAARRRGMSLGPSEIASNSKAATVGAKKPMKFDRDPMTAIKPKNLFDEKKQGLKSTGTAKVRIVPSRYSLTPAAGNESRRRKWSEGEDEEKRKKRSLSLGGGNNLNRSSPSSIMKVAEGLPKIRTMRWGGESPRDSGRAKRVAELVGKELVFAERLKFEDED